MAEPVKDISGMRFGRLTVISRSGYSCRQVSWLCRCDCGGSKIARGTHLRAGATQSCGCLQKEMTSKAKKTHGETYKTPEYRTWRGMINRCELPSHPSYERYGARGITVCERWRDDYPAFLSDMGRRPSDQHSIDRIDNEKGYSPDNCRWATMEEQSFNRRPKRLKRKI